MALPGFKYVVGNGAGFALWHDPWHQDGVLIQVYPRGPIDTGLVRGAKLESVLTEGEWTWPPQTTHELISIVSRLPLIEPGPDRIMWARARNGRFSAASALEMIRPRGPRRAWAGLFQGPGKIPRHLFTTWLAVLERLPTRDRPWIGRGETHCVLCDDHGIETHAHLFFECEYSRQCIGVLSREVRFRWPHNNWDRGVLWAAARWRGKHWINVANRALFAAIVYAIWAERNQRIFEGTETRPGVAASRALDLVKCKLVSMDLPDNIQTRALKRSWHIAW